MGDDHPCIMEGVGTIPIRMFDGMVRELKEVRYVPQLKRNLISVGALESLGLGVSIKEGVLKMTKGSMVVLKADRRNNLYYLKGSTVTGQVAASTSQKEDSIRLWHMRLGHAGEKAMQTLVKKGLLKGAETCKLDLCEHCIIGKKTKVKFGTASHCTCLLYTSPSPRDS